MSKLSSPLIIPFFFQWINYSRCFVFKYNIKYKSVFPSLLLVTAIYHLCLITKLLIWLFFHDTIGTDLLKWVHVSSHHFDANLISLWYLRLKLVLIFRTTAYCLCFLAAMMRFSRIFLSFLGFFSDYTGLVFFNSNYWLFLLCFSLFILTNFSLYSY